ncbi:hypothetical protein BBF96_05740 [Anoxybacter fermentans]|uniref:Polyprenyl synthetase n=1 Tax=Anoxybacter fermentans TaxID=1323375 RepID=A0A3Q9HPZ4_9FIRM|nr:polyprenyl synthetase family protein [Anoxybacter fermentans]AZR72937.1 hypothetical protein BBF96_05740 [Anoxybacter fermentans]
MIIKKIYEHKLKKYRNKINNQLTQIVQNKIDDDKIIEMMHYALESGRRFRPLLFLLTYKIFQPELDNKTYQMATAIELLHKASLVHDDYLDGDKYRRGKASFYHKYGDRMAVIVGDILVSLAFEEFLKATNDPYLVQSWSRLYRLLALGEAKDLIWEGNQDIDTEKLKSMIYGKTASFLEFVMIAGCYLATRNQKLATKMGQFGKEIGFAFQIMNDLNNWCGLEKKLGRLPQQDIISGKVNLVTRLVQQYQTSVIDPAKLKERVTNEAKELALQHIKAAYCILENLDINNKYTKVLASLLKEFDQEWFWVDRDDQ